MSTSPRIPPPQSDAPHTGARLETPFRAGSGHNFGRMPPTRGHDLKHRQPRADALRPAMPPTRGHDLKLFHHRILRRRARDAPHTGARLETSFSAAAVRTAIRCPPRRGHDLKRHASHSLPPSSTDAPHTGARLGTRRVTSSPKEKRCPPHGGTSLKLSDDISAMDQFGCPPHGGTT